jgi:diazepam-binding inhibitor (GABA receptor modulating acyl-CoA-binding protein)
LSKSTSPSDIDNKRRKFLSLLCAEGLNACYDYSVRIINEDIFVGKVNNQEMLILYGYFKQVNEGNNITKKPPFFQLRECAKWEAWYKVTNMTNRDAKEAYIMQTFSLSDKYQFKVDYTTLNW